MHVGKEQTWSYPEGSHAEVYRPQENLKGPSDYNEEGGRMAPVPFAREFSKHERTTWYSVVLRSDRAFFSIS